MTTVDFSHQHDDICHDVRLFVVIADLRERTSFPERMENLTDTLDSSISLSLSFFAIQLLFLSYFSPSKAKKRFCSSSNNVSTHYACA